MKKIFLSFRYTDVPKKDFRLRLIPLVELLREQGYEVYCSIEDEEYFNSNKMNYQEIMSHCLKKLKECDVLLAYVIHDKESRGMVREINKARNGLMKKTVVAVSCMVASNNITGDRTFVFEDNYDLVDQFHEMSSSI